MKRSILFYLIFSGLIAGAADKEHATVVAETPLFVSPGANSQKIISVERGRDLTILERTKADSQDWAKVFVAAGKGDSQRDVTGWLSAKAVVAASTPNGDQIIYGEAVDSENQAEQRGGRKGAAMDAMRLYQRAGEFFPSSPIAG